MNKSEKGAHQDNVVQGSHADPTTISSLIAELAGEDGLVRESARHSLVAIGRPAVPPLIEALAAQDVQVRWEAAKALTQISDPAAAPALVKALQDEVFDVRWLAVEGLIALGGEGLVPLLQELIQHSDSLWLLEGAHHVLHDVAKKGFREMLQPLLAALEDVEPSVEVPFAAQTTLDALTETGSQRGSE